MNAGIFPDDEKKISLWTKVSAAAVKLDISLNLKEHVFPSRRRQILVIKNVVTFSFGTKSGWCEKSDAAALCGISESQNVLRTNMSEPTEAAVAVKGRGGAAQPQNTSLKGRGLKRKTATTQTGSKAGGWGLGEAGEAIPWLCPPQVSEDALWEVQGVLVLWTTRGQDRVGGWWDGRCSDKSYQSWNTTESKEN